MELFRPLVFKLMQARDFRRIAQLKPQQIARTEPPPTDLGRRRIAGFGPLHYAVFLSDAELFEVLVGTFPRILTQRTSAEFCYADYRFSAGADLLSICCTARSIRLVSEAVEAFSAADLQPCRDAFQQTCLHAAAALDTAGARVISSNKVLVLAFLTARRQDGCTPLHLACQCANVAFLEQLVYFGRYTRIRKAITHALQLKDRSGKTAFQYAPWQDNLKLGTLLAHLAKMARCEQGGSVTNWNSEDMNMLAKAESDTACGSFCAEYAANENEDASDALFVGAL